MPAKGTKMTPEEIAARAETRRKNAKGKWKRKQAERSKETALYHHEELPLRIISPAPDVSDVEEFGRFLGAAWRAYKGR